MKFLQIYIFTICTNIICNLDKYIFQFRHTYIWRRNKWKGQTSVGAKTSSQSLNIFAVCNIFVTYLRYVNIIWNLDKHIFQFWHMTGSRLMSWFQSRKWVKVVKLCFKKWNGHILMHIYHIQCEFIQKNQWKGSNGQIHCFCKGNQLRGAKNLEN